MPLYKNITSSLMHTVAVVLLTLLCGSIPNAALAQFAVVVNQQTGTVAQGATNVPVLQVAVTNNSGAGQANTVNSATFVLQNTATADATTAKLYSSTNATFTGAATLLGTQTITSSTQTITFNGLSSSTVTNPNSGNPATLYFYLVMDVSASATPCNLLDARVPANGLQINGTNTGTYPAATADPAGSRQITAIATVSISSTPASPICAGTGVTFTATPTANGGATPTYQWQVNSVNVTGATNATFTTSTLANANTVRVLMNSGFTCLAQATSNVITYTVNPLPTNSAGANKTICFGGSTTVGSASVAGRTYSWTSSPTGFTSTAANPTVSPTVNTTYTLVETISATGCSASNSVTVTVNPLPAANAGSPSTVCAGTSTSVGAAAVAGSTYSWTSSPAGFTSTSSNPTVSPTVTTTYSLTETITATGCVKTNTVVVTVNPLPANTAGMNKVICAGGSTTIGSASAAGRTYSWTSSPSGFTSAVSNPSVSPTENTTYTLVETINATGCSATNNVTVTVNPLPASSVGPDKAICSGASTSIGSAAVTGRTYSWTSSPAGFTSTAANPTVSPTVNTTYTLVETITATTCSASNSVVVTVNPLPAAATGGAQAVCNGNAVTLGAAAVSGNTYAWTSNPAGFTSALSDPTVSPTVTTTYSLTETIAATGCSKTGTAIVTVNAVPAAAVSPDKVICLGGTTTIGAANVNSTTYSWTSSPTGFTSTVSNPSVPPTVTTTYTLTQTVTATGCSASNSVVVTVNPLPDANAGAAQAVCSGNATTIGATAVSGNTYSWTSSPAGFTSNVSNPSVSPNVNTTYTLTETITATGCAKTGTVVITVNPLPAANASTSSAICIGGSKVLGAAAVAGSTYEWTSSPAGFTSTVSNPTVSPTETTTYTLTQTITATGCTKSNTVVVTVNTLPAANAGSNAAVCLGSSTQIGAAAVAGSTYSWTSSQSGFTSTAANPTVTPTVTTTYTVTQTVTGTSCTNSNSVVITVNPLPAASVGTANAVCSGATIQIGGGAVSDNTYSWTSSPSGFTSNVSNPTVSPTVNTTYSLTETIVATGCTKTNTLAVTVNPLPAANAGTSSTICVGGNKVLGATAVAGRTYSWTSSPAGFTSAVANPTGSPTVTTTYTLVEAITATGCTNTNSVVVTVNPLPVADAGANASVCSGSAVSIGAPAVAGSTYSWTSSPTGFTSTLSSPSVSPTVNTTYSVTETITATGCNKTNTVVVTVNPLPVANAGSSSGICIGGSKVLGAASVAGSTYEWASSPAGFTSTISNPTVSPTVTTTYTLTQTITATGCTKSNTVVVTVSPLPAANVGTNNAVCTGSSIQIGAAAVTGTTYAWTSSPGTFTTTVANPTVSPTVNTTYTLTQTITSTGCSNSNTLPVAVNPLPAAATGSNTSVCNGSSTTIGAAAVAGNTYSWTSNPSGFTSNVSNPTVSPTVNTTYTLTETITATGCVKSNNVTVTVNPLPAAAVISNNAICPGGSIAIGAAPVNGTTYSWVSDPVGFTSTVSNPTVSPTEITTYTLTQTITATGCSKSNSVVIGVNPVPTSDAGPGGLICAGGSLTIGTPPTSGSTYNWTSSPSGFTSSNSNPTVSPTVTTTYSLTETTAAGCIKVSSAVATVNTIYVAPQATTPICVGQSATLTANGYKRSSYTNTNTFTIPAGSATGVSSPVSVSGLLPNAINANTVVSVNFNITHAKISLLDIYLVAPNGTQVQLVEGSVFGGTAANFTNTTISATATNAIQTGTPPYTGTFASFQSLAGLNGTPNGNWSLKVVQPVSGGVSGGTINNWSITLNSNNDLTYSWTSNPAGFTSAVENPTVSPTVTTTYTVSVNDAVSGNCTASGSVVVTVNPLPAANAGSNAVICSGSSTTLGAAAVAGRTYSWTSSPTGFTSAIANPSVTPTVTTTYTLTETITATGCSANNSVTATVNPVPAAVAGSNVSICNGNSTIIGAASVAGNTYSWTSNPAGFTSTASNPNVTPTATTTYTLTETITATGCTKTNTVVVTVNPLPAAAVASNSTICSGVSVSIGAVAIAGTTYSWTSSPSGFTSTASNPSVSPTVTTTYTLVQTITATGCNKSNSVVITVNPAPPAAAGTNATICSGNSTTIGGAATAGNTYSWTSSPAGFTSNVSNPTVAPTVTTTYTLSETVTATGCVKSGTVIITVNPLPAANAGTSSAICVGGTKQLGATSVTGTTYSWTSNPAGFTSNVSNPTVSPTITTTYTLTQTITATGCSKSNTVVVTVNPLPAANVGPAANVCYGSAISLGAPAVAGNTYSWTSVPTGLTSNISNPTANPTDTTTYTLTETITATGCSKTNSVTVTIMPQITANPTSNSPVCLGDSVKLFANAFRKNKYTNLNDYYIPPFQTQAVSPINISGNGQTTINSNTVFEIKFNINHSKINLLEIWLEAPNGSQVQLVNGQLPSPSFPSAANQFVNTTISATSTNQIHNAAMPYTGTFGSYQSLSGLNGPLNGLWKLKAVQPTNPGESGYLLDWSITLNTVDGIGYEWTSTPSGFTSSLENPVLLPTVAGNTTYHLTATDNTFGGCSATGSTVVTVNPLPAVPTVASANVTVCSGQPATLSATAPTGVTFRWYNTATGGTLLSSNATYTTPALTTATSYFVESVSAAGCKSARTQVNVAVNPVPAAVAGSNTAVCNGNSTTIGTAAVSGNTYSWTSNPSGFTSTLSNPTVSPTLNTTYTLTETITATGCTKTASVVVTVNPLPAANAGTGGTICSGNSITLGTAAVTGSTYEWTSNPAGFSSTVSNPSVSPTVTTTYSLTQTITATGCSKTNTVTVNVSPLPASNVGANNAVCAGSQIQIGAAPTAGRTYAWTSIPAGFTSTVSNPTVSPTVNTTYTLTETITGTGCFASNTLAVTVNALPLADAGFDVFACPGTNTVLGTAPAAGHTYNWISVPAGFTSTQSNPTVSPLASTLYILSVTNTASGCNKADSVTVTMSPSGQWVGVTSTAWDDATNWCGSIPTISDNAIIPAGTPFYPVIVPGVNAVAKDLVVATAATVDLTGGTLTLSGNMLPAANTFTQTGGELIFQGTVTQTVNPVAVTDVVVDNPAGIELLGDMTVSGTLLFNDGLVNTGVFELNVTNPAFGALSNYDLTRYVNGNLRRAIGTTGTYDFPVGTALQYELAQLTLNNLQGVSNVLARFTPSITGAAPNLTVNGTLLNTLLNAGFWTLTPNQQPTNGTYDITLNGRGHTNPAISQLAYAVLKRADVASPWTHQGVTITGSQVAGGGTVTVPNFGLSSFSDFAIGYGNAVLPVTLTTFTAVAANGNAVLDWHTASEYNNAYFDVERSLDGMSFEALGKVTGHGTTEAPHNYQFVDHSPATGVNYYRLKQVDFDGTTSYSGIRAVSFNEVATELITLYPVPASDVLNVTGITKNDVVQVYDLSGKLLLQQIADGKLLTFHLDGLSAGTYMLKVGNDAAAAVQLFIKQ